MTHLGDPTGEAAFISQMFASDAKNYHVWSYRQWLVRTFDLWDGEIVDIERLLDEDVRNNSAWNHRWFVVFGRGEVGEEVVEREIEYVQITTHVYVIAWGSYANVDTGKIDTPKPL